MNSVSTLRVCANGHLRHYVDPASLRAFHVYDRLGDPSRFEPTDALAPGLLDAPVPTAVVVQLFSTINSPFTALRRAMQHLLDGTELATPSFGELDLDDAAGPWALMRTVLKLSNGTSGLKASKVTKMLHRKRPEFVPIFDSKVAAFYGTTSRTPWLLWPLLQRDLNEHHDQLSSLAAGLCTPDGRQLSLLRTLDIVVWEHMVTRCGT